MQPQSLLRLGDLESASVKELERLLDLNEKNSKKDLLSGEQEGLKT